MRIDACDGFRSGHATWQKPSGTVTPLFLGYPLAVIEKPLLRPPLLGDLGQDNDIF